MGNEEDCRLAVAVKEDSGSLLVASSAEFRAFALLDAFHPLMEDVLPRTSTDHALRGYVETAQDIALLPPNRFANRSIVSYLLNEQTFRLCSIAQLNISSFLCYG